MRWPCLHRIALLSAVAVGLGCALADDAARRRLPDLPILTGHNAATIARMTSAYEAALAHPRDVEALAELAMTLHAHQFDDLAATVYALVIERDSEDWRWPYLKAVAADAAGRWDLAKAAYRRASVLAPTDPDVLARLGTILMKLGEIEAGKVVAHRAYLSDPTDPLAALGESRLRVSDQDWNGVIEVLTPIVETYPRFSDAHKQLARAYEMLGKHGLAQHHLIRGQFGAPVDRQLLEDVFARAVPALLGGDPAGGQALVETRCIRCHTLDRTYVHPDADPLWWATTIRRMQRLAGKAFITDDEGATIVAYLSASRRGAGGDPAPPSGTSVETPPPVPPGADSTGRGAATPDTRAP